jgi:serine/threonine protein kinase
MKSKLPTFETPFESYPAKKIIGEGGAGRVYEANNDSGEIVAIKCLAPERITSERQKRFKNEISFCQSQNHKNIVHVIDTGAVYIKEVKCPFYVMPLYSGTLRTHMEGLQSNNVLPVFSQILDGIETAHLSGVWHRDIKPENVLWNEGNNQLVVADFGIAHFEEDEIYTAVETRIATRMANFLYSAPEQRVRGAQVDHRADIFSLGLLLNELFTGEIPQGTGYKRIAQVSQEHGYLDDIVESMIQQNPDNRVNSIEEIKKELIGHKNAFVALQRFEESKNQVIKVSEPQEFEEINIASLDYGNGTLTLLLGRNVPPGWAQEFQHPRGGHSSLLGYGPENFQIRGNKATIGVREDENFVQQIVNHAKNYVSAANRGYAEQQREHARQEERRQREQYEKEVTESELRKNILSRIKL